MDPHPLGDTLAGTHVCYSVPAPVHHQGAPGYGLAVYVRRTLAPCVRHVSHSSGLCHSVVLQLSGCRVFLVNVYLRPSVVMDVAVSSLATHLQQLQPQPSDLGLPGTAHCPSQSETCHWQAWVTGQMRCWHTAMPGGWWP